MSAQRISIAVVGAGIEATLASLEHAEQDLIEVIVEPDTQPVGEALTRAFARARGEVCGWLLAGERLLPGALSHIGTQIDPARDRHVVMGRAVLVHEGRLALPHPSEYLGRFDHLAVWKRGFDAVPRASLFWHRGVLDRIGGLPSGDACAIDYEFVCRLERHYTIHTLDEVWSAIDAVAWQDAAGRAEPELLQAWIATRRRYWGPWFSPLRWRCQLSWWSHRLQRHDHARHHARLAEQAAREGRPAEARLERIKAGLYSPAMWRGRFGPR